MEELDLLRCSLIAAEITQQIEEAASTLESDETQVSDYKIRRGKSLIDPDRLRDILQGVERSLIDEYNAGRLYSRIEREGLGGILLSRRSQQIQWQPPEEYNARIPNNPFRYELHPRAISDMPQAYRNNENLRWTQRLQPNKAYILSMMVGLERGEINPGEVIRFSIPPFWRSELSLSCLNECVGESRQIGVRFVTDGFETSAHSNLEIVVDFLTTAAIWVRSIEVEEMPRSFDMVRSFSRPQTPSGIGDRSCEYNAKSQYLRCAIAPDGDCNTCHHHSKHKSALA